MEFQFGNESVIDSDDCLMIFYWDWANNRPEVKAHKDGWDSLDQLQKEATFRAFASLALDFSPYANLTPVEE